jgi:alpha-1,3-fucosyltransferase
VWQCETYENRTDAHQYDAVIFNLRGWEPNNLPHRRLPHQRYVFWSWEAPVWRIYGDDTSAMGHFLGHFFNWTMTHRWDSDMVAPYGYITPTGNVPLHPSPDQMKKLLLSSDDTTKVNYAKGKTKMAAWFVSHCNSQMSRRIEMVKILQNYIQVDVYGDCGNLTCPKKRDKSFVSSDECRDMVAKNYKLYFALENSLCRHYVTEK